MHGGNAPSRRNRHDLGAPHGPVRTGGVPLFLFVVLAAGAVAEVFLRSRGMLYSGDEIFNLDAALNLLRHGDYTTWQFGGVRFDPAISSGILATWIHGMSMAAGNTLFTARLLSGLAHLVIVTTFAFMLFRDRRFGVPSAALAAMCTWIAMLPITAHELRIVNPGELWGFAYLALGVGLLRRHRIAAAFCWGLAVWLCKIIYAPFGAALLATAWWNERAEHRVVDGERVAMSFVDAARDALLLAAAFLAPLLLWMSLIWIRYDARTVMGWCFANLAFVTKHATGHAIEVSTLPVLEGWRFEPHWPEASFLRMGSHVTVRALLPLSLGPALRLVHAALTAAGRLDPAPSVRRVLDVLTAVVALFSVWFLALDPTQWGRHLLPAIYVSLAVALYCSADIATGLLPSRASSPASRGSRAAGVVLAATLAAAVAYAARFTGESREVAPWRPSYAKTCTAGGELLQPPCTQERAREIIAQLTREICGYEDRAFDQDCMRKRSAEFFARAAAVAETDNANPTWVYAGGYIVLFVEGWAYDSADRFYEDLTPTLCSQPNLLFRQYLRQAGIDVDRLLARCG